MAHPLIRTPARQLLDARQDHARCLRLRNPFRRQTETATPSLRDHVADLSARLASTTRKPEPAAAPIAGADEPATIEFAATLDFPAYALDDPLKTPTEWANRFNSPAMAMHVADRTLRMTKPELIAFIRKAGETDAATPEIMFRNLDASQETLEGWGKLLSVARTRYLVAASAACLEPSTDSETVTGATEPAAPVEDTFAAAPTDLADACCWVLRHRAWVDRSLEATDWSDEKFDAETGKTNAVITRAINEPSTHLAEIVAKAALALDDFERFQVTPHRDTDDGTRIVHTVLREVAAFQVEADAAPVPGIDFGPDAHIAELAAEFCEAYAANNKADREHMAGNLPEAEWTPYYRRTVALMDRLEATKPKTLLGMALKCLAPIGLAGWNAPADGNTDGMDPWERVGAQLVEATMAGTLTPFEASDPRPADLLAAAGISLEALSVSDLCSIYDAADTLSVVASALTCQPRQMTNWDFNGAGRLVENTAFALHAVIEAAAKELRSRSLTEASEQELRAVTLARLTIDNGDPAETAAFARQLLAMIEP